MKKFFGVKNSQISFIRRSFQGLKLDQRRGYCQVTKTCWSCKATLSSSGEIFCESCAKIQKVPNIIDYFNLFGIQKQHQVDINDLTSRFRKFQSQIHPDKFSGKSEEEQTLSSEWSSLINKAYKVLQAPLERGEYLLKLHGIALPEDNTITDPEFLMEMMEKNEEVEEATTKEDLMKILLNLRDEISGLSEVFSSHYQSGSHDDAKINLIKMKYLTSIEKSIKEKLLRL